MFNFNYCIDCVNFKRTFWENLPPRLPDQLVRCALPSQTRSFVSGIFSYRPFCELKNHDGNCADFVQKEK